MTQQPRSSNTSTHRSTSHDLAAADGSVRPLMTTIASTLALALVLIVFAATGIDISALDLGTALSA